MFMLLVRAERIQAFDPEDSDDRTEHVGLFEVDVDQLRCLTLNVADSFLDVDWQKVFG
jgi:hypothetical protein